MSVRELSRVEVVSRVEEKRLSQREGALELGITSRQMRRLQQRYRECGAKGLVSRRRGRPSNNRLSEAFKAEVLSVVRERYADFGPTLAQEKLLEVHGLRISKESLRGMMIECGLWKPRRGHPMAIHQMRQRRARYGELIQIDGSPHDWFEGRSGACTLLVLIDDATGQLMYLQFVEAETTQAYFDAMESYIRHYGKPLTLYSDRHGVFKVNSKEAHQSDGVTQFGRAMKELDIELICARTPQAKGRVERANGILQDRLVKEMRLQGINTMAEGNAMLASFMEAYNQKFGRSARHAEDAHRPLERGVCLETILTKQQTRTLSKNLTVQYGRVIYQIKTRRPSYALRHAAVLVCENRNGEVLISREGKVLDYEIHHQHSAQGTVVSSKDIDITINRKAPEKKPVRRSPALKADHPWRRSINFATRRYSASP
jgi:transposase